MGTKHERLMIGVFHTAGDARRAIGVLRDAGFSDEKIGLLTHDKDGDPEVKSFRDLEGNKAGRGAAIGAAAGAGGGALWALGIAGRPARDRARDRRRHPRGERYVQFTDFRQVADPVYVGDWWGYYDSFWGSSRRVIVSQRPR